MALTDERKKAIVGAVRTLLNEVNSLSPWAGPNGAYDGPGDVAEQFVDELLRSHRTLQQSLVGVVKVVLERYAEACVEDNRYDLRNDAAASWAREVSKIEGGDALDQSGVIKKWVFVPGQGFGLI